MGPYTPTAAECPSIVVGAVLAKQCRPASPQAMNGALNMRFAHRADIRVCPYSRAAGAVRFASGSHGLCPSQLVAQDDKRWWRRCAPESNERPFSPPDATSGL